MKPNYFLSLRVCSQQVFQNIAALQKSIADQNSDYVPGFVDPRTAHITLGVMELKSADFVNAFNAMQDALRKVKEISKDDAIIHLDGLNDFDGEVLYLSVRKDDSYQYLLSLVDTFKKTFTLHGVPLKEEGRYTAHVTVWKLIKSYSYFKKKSIVRIPQDLYKGFLDNYFGCQVIDQISLCSMNASKDQDGYYKVIACVNLKTGEFTDVDSCIKSPIESIIQRSSNNGENFRSVEQFQSPKEAFSVAPINIAVIKYWGKRCEELNLPLNSSISVTLHVDDLCTKTEVKLSDDTSEDTFYLNGVEESLSKNNRLQRCLKAVRDYSMKLTCQEENSKFKGCRIISSNNFPTAAGLASSAAGYACLAKCLGTVYGVDMDLSIIARLGSGSACRSMYGGFVKWLKGDQADGTDSIAVQIADEHHWVNLRVLILVVSSAEKPVGSTEGMKRSLKTSEFLKYRVEQCLDERLKLMEEAIQNKNFQAFAELTMKDSNQLHAVCQDSYPPIIYMNSISHEIVQFVTAYNAHQVKAAYTFDAGPNAVLFTLAEHYDELLATVLKYFPPGDILENYVNHPCSYIQGLSGKEKVLNGIKTHHSALQRIISTKPGPGASITVK